MPANDPLMISAAVVFVLIAFVFLPIIRLSVSRRQANSRLAKHPEKWVIVDGSNVMYWQNGEPNIETVRRVVEHLVAAGFTPGVMFDANAGYLLTGQYRHDRYLSAALSLPEDRVMVVPKGMPADPAILKAARDLGGRIVSNDRFRDWVAEFPEVRRSTHLIRGSFKSGRLALHLNPKGSTNRARKKRSA